jgi:hypothetical protein
MVGDAFRTKVNLVTGFARAQAVIDILPPIPIRRIESTQFLPRASSKEGAGGRHYLKSPGYGRCGMVAGKPSVKVVGEGVEANDNAGMLNRVVREEELGPDYGGRRVPDGIIHERREPA